MKKLDDFIENSTTMNHKAKDELHHDMLFSYEYDYGTTTQLGLYVYSIINNDDSDRSVQLLARNNSIVHQCQSYQNNTIISIYITCMWDECGFLCNMCKSRHGCNESIFLPVVNLQRMGMCVCGNDDMT